MECNKGEPCRAIKCPSAYLSFILIHLSYTLRESCLLLFDCISLPFLYLPLICFLIVEVKTKLVTIACS